MKLLTLPAPQLRPARFEDYEEIERLWVAHSWEFPALDEWRSVWLENPLWWRLGKDRPIGWVLQTATGEIVGSLGSVPRLYKFQGQDLICGNPIGWVVTAGYRGYAPWLFEEYFNQSNIDLFINPSTAAIAVPIFDLLSERIPLGDWETASIWAIGYVGLAQKILRTLQVPLAGLLAYPAGGALWLKGAICYKPLPKTAVSFAIEATDQFDSRFDGFWNELLRKNAEKLLAERSSRTLSWHFGMNLRRRRLWIFTASRNHLLRAYCVLNCFEGGRRVRLVDYQTIEPGVDLLPGLLQAALRRCAKEDVYFLENWGRGVPKMRALDECAPYRRKLSSWSFFYRAADPALHAKLRTARFWDPSAYDGDAGFVYWA